MSRLKEFRIAKNALQKEIAELLGIGQDAYSLIEKGKAQLQLKHLEKLALEMRLNPNWLILGDGEMLLKEGEENSILSATTLYNLSAPIKEMKIDIKKNSFVLPFFESASAGYVVGYGDITQDVYLDVYGLAAHREQLVRGFYVQGDSMYPSLNTGDVVFCRRILDRLNAYFHPLDMYVVISREGVNIKFILDSGDTLTLISENKRFREYVLPKENILELWVVERVLKDYRHGVIAL